MNNISMIEYSLLAILLGIMYAFSAIEILLIKYKDPDAKVVEFQKSTLWAITGIIFTLLVGFLSETLVKQNSFLKGALLICPLFFIGRWLVWYLKSTKVAGDIQHLKQMVDNHLKREIKKTIELAVNNGNNQLTKKFITSTTYSKFISHSPSTENFKFELLSEVSKLAKTTKTLSDYDVFLDLFEISETRIECIFHRLLTENELTEIQFANSPSVYRLK